MALTDETKKKNSSWMISGAVLLGLFLMIIFAWRVARFVNLIKSGQLTAEDLRFINSQSVSSTIILPEVADFDWAQIVDARDPQLGNPEAQVTIVEFSDFDCPYSRRAAYNLRAAAAQYGEQINWIVRDFPLLDLHPNALLAAQAAACAGEQNRYWEYHDKLFTNQDDHSKNRLLGLARELNLNMATFSGCLDSERTLAEIDDDFTGGVTAGVQGTPTFFINGRRIPGVIPEKQLFQIIDQQLAQ